jgi:hypothetical protein
MGFLLNNFLPMSLLNIKAIQSFLKYGESPKTLEAYKCVWNQNKRQHMRNALQKVGIAYSNGKLMGIANLEKVSTKTLAAKRFNLK